MKAGRGPTRNDESASDLAALRESGTFDEEWYLEQYPDVKMLGMDPAEHYLWLGRRIGRSPTRSRAVANLPDTLSPVRSIALSTNFSAPPLAHKPVRIIAFYLPQFHPIPENDRWWGDGFTEWTNVRPAQPQFVGHYQPHVPGELGYYDLRDKNVQKRQIELAKVYGIEGFCFYFYWFEGKRLLEKPLENWLQDRGLDLPFCLCWANENWSRRWDGQEKDLLVAQRHSPHDDVAFIAEVARYFRDERYIRIQNKPLLLVYRPSLLPSARETAERWRIWCREAGIGEIYLACTHSFETADPTSYGFDAAVEFPPNNSAPPVLTDKVIPLREDFAMTVYDWTVFPERSRDYTPRPYKIFRSVCPIWDNTARRKKGGTAFINSTPALYQEWLKNAIRDSSARFDADDERLIFVNAWNEWGEGAHLEPDMAHGYSYLQATWDAQHDFKRSDPAVVLVSHDAYPHGAQYLALNLARACKEFFRLRVEMILLGDGPLKKDFARFAHVHEFARSDLGGERLRALLRQLRDRTNLAICNTTVSGVVTPALKEAGFTVISLVHELPELIRQHGLEGAAKAMASYSDRIVFAAGSVAREFARFADVSPEKIVIRPQGLYKVNRLSRLAGGTEQARMALRKKFGLAPETPIVLSVGYADRRKGVDLFVDAGVRLLKIRPDARFLWLGNEAEPAWMEKAKAAATRAGLMDSFLFPGFDENTDLYYAGADVYALTSREDAYPSVVLEAMDCGLPVVAFAGTGGMAELIEEAGGINVPALDTEAFAAALAGYVADARLKENVNERGPAIIKRDYSFRRYVHNLLHNGNVLKWCVSVIVPNYNYARYIVSRLESIRRQTVPPYEIIVLDDASTDDSRRIIESWLAGCSIPHVVVHNEHNSGSVCAQWRNGIEQARGEFVWIAEADDLADPEFLAEVLPAFARANLVMSYCQSRQMDVDGNILCEDYLDYVADIDSERWKKSYVIDGRAEIARALYLKNTIPNISGAVFRREAILDTLRTHEDEITSYRNAGDWITYIKLLRNGSIAFSPRALNSHRRHVSSVTLSSFNLAHLKEIATIQAKVAQEYALSKDARLKANAYVQKLYHQFRIDRDNVLYAKDHPELGPLMEVTDACS